MSIHSIGLKAYANAIQAPGKTGSSTGIGSTDKTSKPGGGFADAIQESLKSVNDLQTEKSTMIQSFASGENQNVHELMITLQKAGLAMNMTSAVRNKVMEAYKQLMQMPF